MKTLFLTLCAIASLGANSFAGDFFPYTLDDFNNDQDYRAWQAEQNAERRAQELQNRLDEIEAQLEAQNEQPEDPQAQPQTLPRVQTLSDYTSAGKAQELIKSWQIGQTRSVHMRDGQTINATLLGQVDSYNHLPRHGKPGDAWLVAGTPWIWEHPAGTTFSTWIDL